ncbi:MAG TPA: DUF4296 domain-containing protein [Bacteroidia bacterium]|nr:DUF4296 domain-containing protein [Bacteroidia bacterium]
MEIKKGISYYCLLFFCCLLLTNCHFKKEIIPPANLIGADSMELILTDLTITEAALNNGVPNDTVRKVGVLANYNISVSRFDSSFAYYTQNPKKLKEIYAKVLEDLNKK